VPSVRTWGVDRNVDTIAEAARQFTSVQQMFNDMRTGRRRNLQAPVDPAEIAAQGGTSPMLSISAVGSPDTTTEQMAAFVRRTGAGERITVTSAYAPEVGRRSLKLLADAWF